MNAARALDRPFPGADRPSLSIGMQWASGIIVILILAGSYVVTGSFLVFEALFGGALLLAICLNPIASIYAFILVNVALALHGKDRSTTSSSALDVALGIVLVAVMAYWFLRLRLFERSSLSTTVGQLSLSIFAVWAVFVTVIGLLQPHSSLNDAVRELLNLSPLVILPVLYSRYVQIGSRAEKWIFITVLLAGLTMIVWNFFRMKSNIAQAYYLFQIGRGNTDEMLAVLLALLGTSFLMSVRGLWKVLGATLLLALGLLGVVISLARTLYVAVLVCIIVILFLGTRKEFWRGVRRLSFAFLVLIAGLIPLYHTSHLFRLLAINYGSRFISTQHLGTDLSLVNRYVEWRYEWHAILGSPILGRGFGRQFRVYNMIEHFHSWLGFSHSSYLYIMNKGGFLGFFLFFFALVSFVIHGYRLLKTRDSLDSHMILLRSFLAFLLALIIYCYTAPALNSKTDLIWVGLIWGYFLSLERWRASRTSHGSSTSESPELRFVGGTAL